MPSLPVPIQYCQFLWVQKYMFSTPQSKAFFSQEIIKGKLITQELQLVNHIHERVTQSKAIAHEILKILLGTQTDTTQVESRLLVISDHIQCALFLVSESNELFSFEVSLRSDIKNLEHSFFKHILELYEDKIRELKQCLLLLEHKIQELEQKGFLPYVENPEKNAILSVKYKNYHQFRQKLELVEKVLSTSKSNKLQRLVSSIIKSILYPPSKCQMRPQDLGQSRGSNPVGQKLQQLDKSEQIYSPPQVKQVQKNISSPTPPKKVASPPQNNVVQAKESKFGIADALQLLYHWQTIMKSRIRSCNQLLKKKIETLSLNNKIMKQGIRNYKKIMSFEQKEAMVRCGYIQFTREQAIDFLREVSEDLQLRFQRRNIYMVVSCQYQNSRSKSCTLLRDVEQQDEKGKNPHCLKQISNNLNNSFLEQCSYLISDRFMGNEDQNQQMIV